MAALPPGLYEAVIRPKTKQDANVELGGSASASRCARSITSVHSGATTSPMRAQLHDDRRRFSSTVGRRRSPTGPRGPPDAGPGPGPSDAGAAHTEPPRASLTTQERRVSATSLPGSRTQRSPLPSSSPLRRFASTSRTPSASSAWRAGSWPPWPGSRGAEHADLDLRERQGAPRLRNRCKRRTARTCHDRPRGPGPRRHPEPCGCCGSWPRRPTRCPSTASCGPATCRGARRTTCSTR